MIISRSPGTAPLFDDKKYIPVAVYLLLLQDFTFRDDPSAGLLGRTVKDGSATHETQSKIPDVAAAHPTMRMPGLPTLATIYDEIDCSQYREPCMCKSFARLYSSRLHYTLFVERLHVRNHLPELLIGQLGPRWHALPHISIHQQPVQIAFRGLLLHAFAF
jgi:hypothetical protein